MKDYIKRTYGVQDEHIVDESTNGIKWTFEGVFSKLAFNTRKEAIEERNRIHPYGKKPKLVKIGYVNGKPSEVLGFANKQNV